MKRFPILVVLLGLAALIVTPSLGAGKPYPKVTLKDKTWHCKGPQNHTQVNVRITNENIDAVHLDAGCTGSIRVRIFTMKRDGIKVHAGAHDLEVWGSIRCKGKNGIVHQDGVQAMGGDHVTLKWLGVRCPTGNNGGLFVNTGTGGKSTPTDILCEHCNLFEGNAAVHGGPHSRRSGVRDSTLWAGTGRASPANCVRVDKAAIEPVNSGNECRKWSNVVPALPPAPRP
jgi:hypothetical protein